MAQWFHCLETLLFEKILLDHVQNLQHRSTQLFIWVSAHQFGHQIQEFLRKRVECNVQGRNKAPWWSESSQSQLLDNRDFSVLSQESCCMFLYFTSMRSYEYFLFPHPVCHVLEVQLASASHWMIEDSSWLFNFFWLHSFRRVGQWTSDKGSLPPKCHWLLWTQKWDVMGCLYSIRNLTPHELRLRVFCSKWPLPSLSTSLIQWTNSSSAGHCPKQRMAVPNSLVEMEPPPSKSLEPNMEQKSVPRKQ